MGHPTLREVGHHDLAGVTFATHVCDAKLSLVALATSFRVEEFLPDASDPWEGISW